MICLLELELQMAVSYHVVLGSKLEYSARGLRDLTHRATLSFIWTWDLLIRLGWLASEPQGIYLVCLSRIVTFKCILQYIMLGSNSGPHLHKISILVTVPQPFLFNIFFCYFKKAG